MVVLVAAVIIFWPQLLWDWRIWVMFCKRYIVSNSKPCQNSGPHCWDVGVAKHSGKHCSKHRNAKQSWKSLIKNTGTNLKGGKNDWADRLLRSHTGPLLSRTPTASWSRSNCLVTGPYLFTRSEVQRGEGAGEMSTTAASNREDVKKPHVHPTGIETQVDVMAGSHSTWRKYSYAHTSHSVTPRVSPRITSCVQQYLGGIETASGKKLLSRNSHTQRERNFRNHKVLIWLECCLNSYVYYLL